MSNLIITSIFIYTLMYCNAVYLGEQANYYKPKLERNNILNKGLWMKDKVEKSNYGDFIFRADSGGIDNLIENNFDAFGDNFMDAIPVFSSYVERNKRSAILKQNQQLKKGVKNCKDKMKCLKKDNEKQPLFKSKFISQLRPASVFNDYPYEVAVLLANSNKREIDINDNTKSEVEPITASNIDLDDNVKINTLDEHNKSDYKALEELGTALNNKTAYKIPKRRMTQPNFELEVKEKSPLDEVNNNTMYIDGNKINRNVFDKEERIWQSAPIQNMVLPRTESTVKNKPVTEKGLVKVLSLLTKTFRKVMKQHNEIQEIDNKLHSLNEEFMKNIAILDTKFQEFDVKYSQIIGINKDLQHLNEKFTKKINDIEHKDTVMSLNLREFENQQKKFLGQQHQFYTIQKFMLEQNEKINRKQSIIAKTQSEISHRQNNFARVLKKAKQFYMDNKLLTASNISSIFNKPTNKSNIKEDNTIKITTPIIPVSTDSVKINLFSIPKIGPLLDHDKLILEEKNDKPVDDLVYKYYFNNTFIDNLMKSKVLTAVVDNEAKNIRNVVKNKRNDLSNETTILLPVNSNVSPNIQRRERRWIRHPNKTSRKFHDKEASNNEKNLKVVKEGNVKVNQDNKNDAFMTMATKFCIEVGQNEHEQMLNWCVEKSLRKLKSIDMILPIKPLVAPPLETVSKKDLPPKAINLNSVQGTTKFFHIKTSTLGPIYSSNPPMISTPKTLTSTPETVLNNDNAPVMFFPDNDELESNLKQYELKPDPEGTVYFDGSLHTSDIVISESDALSDIMPGLDSNSHVDLDPLALDLQARRRAYVRRLNENILKTMNYK